MAHATAVIGVPNGQYALDAERSPFFLLQGGAMVVVVIVVRSTWTGKICL
jgi:hypothetical protein